MMGAGVGAGGHELSITMAFSALQKSGGLEPGKARGPKTDREEEGAVLFQMFDEEGTVASAFAPGG